MFIGRKQNNVSFGAHKFPARVKCAIQPWHAVVAAIVGKDEPVTTATEDA